VAASFLLTLREGLEAALIVGIIAAYVVKVGRRDALPKIGAGVVAAVALSIGAGVAVVLTVRDLPIIVQETLEGAAGLIAVAVLTWMLFWMRRQGRHLKGELERGVDLALSEGTVLALVGLAFVAAVREGLETVLFFLAIFSSAGAGAEILIGGLLGLAVSAGLGWAIFVGGRRIDLRRFFSWTGAILVFVSAGLVAFSVHEFGEAGLIPNPGVAFDVGSILPETSPVGSVLSGLFGYRSKPSPLELAGWLAYLIPTLTLFLLDSRWPIGRRTANA
jgi:high-affinity iron transporter